NFRNFSSAELVFQKGVNTIVGENGSGKTNLFRAIRLLLDENLIRSAYRLESSDFHRAIGDWRGQWIIISLEFKDISQDEAIQSLFLHGTGNIVGPAVDTASYTLVYRPKLSVRTELSKLENGDIAGLSAIREAITTDDYETTFFGKSSCDFNDEKTYKELVGDFENVVFSEELEPEALGVPLPRVLSIHKEVSLTFVKALRDVVAEFQNNRRNPLLKLLDSKSGEIDPSDFAPIAKLVTGLNASIEGLKDVDAVRSDIRDTIIDAAGKTYAPSSLAIRSSLSAEAEELFQSLQLFVGEHDEEYQGAIHELSLGGANLIYLTLKLLEFKYQKAKQSFANFLLIEEPEAHIHTHIQKTLFERLSYSDTQIIYSTHSPQISEVSNIESLNVLARIEGRCDAFQPASGLLPNQIRNVSRYLDAVRSNLLFAKSVVLVEGDAEEILIPVLFKEIYGVSLDELGISLINIRSTGFKNVAMLFHSERIRKRCAIVTDLDKAFFDTTPQAHDEDRVKAEKKKALGSETSGAIRKRQIDAYCEGNPWIDAFYATHTFEVDLVLESNSFEFKAIVDDVYRQTKLRKLAKEELDHVGDPELCARRALSMANRHKKGWFAVLLSSAIKPHTFLPSYILEAVLFAHGEMRDGILLQMIKHRALTKGLQQDADRETIADQIELFEHGVVELDELKQVILETIPDDQIAALIEAL
ncbi:MAG: AAA family ATPase, partial [Pseudomonadota bacterium]|nr:AAA family ATPase [Pseudomonadota bacterium]